MNVVAVVWIHGDGMVSQFSCRTIRRGLTQLCRLIKIDSTPYS